MRRTHPLHIISGLLLCLLAATARADDGGVALAVKPGDIVIGTSYTGTTLHFSGEAPRGSAIVARFTGASGDLALRQKGKAFGLLWMNMGTVHLHDVPSVYLVTSSRPLADIGGTGLGLDAVRAGVKQEDGAAAQGADVLDVPAELVRLKQHDGLYREGVGGITVTDDGAFSAELDIPSRMSPGTYTVDVFALRDIEDTADGGKIKERYNGSGATVRGLNAEGRAVFTRWFELQAGVTWQRSRYVEPEYWSEDKTVPPVRRMFRTPDLYGYFTASLKPLRNFTADVTGTCTGEMLVQHMAGSGVERDVAVTTPAFCDVNLRLAYDLRVYKEITLQLYGGVQNLFNAYQSDFDQGKNRDSSYIYGPASPRSYFAGVKMSF